MKNNYEKHIKWYIAIMVSSLIAILGLYLYNFHDGLTNNINAWGNTGSFIGGLLSPILTVINIFVFIDISRLLSKFDDKRAEKDIKAQKAITLMQFRKNEIEHFEKVMEEALLPHEEHGLSPQVLARPIVNAVLYVKTFLSSKLSIFNLEENDNITQQLRELHKQLILLNKDFIKPNSNDKIGNDLINDIISLRESIVSDLQNITLSNIYKG